MSEQTNTPGIDLTGLDDAKRLIQAGEASCVVLRDGEIVKTAVGNGVKPILGLLENEPEALKDAVVADKVIGKAAAMLLTLAGAQYVHGEIMSESGRRFLESRGIGRSYGTSVEAIINRTGDDLCPLEKTVLDIEEPEEALPALKATIAILMRGNQSRGAAAIPIEDAGKEEANRIVNGLIHYNSAQLKLENEAPFLKINRCVKDGSEVVGGIIAQLYWNVLYVDVLWVSETHRGKGYATALLNDAEGKAKEMNCKLVHLDTFDFQAREMYEKLGYTVFGVLEDCPEGHCRYYMSKRLV